MATNPFQQIAQEMGPDASNLVAQLTLASMSASSEVAQQLIDNQARQIKELQAELWLIRITVTDLISGPWMPTPARIQAALYATREEIREIVENEMPLL